MSFDDEFGAIAVPQKGLNKTNLDDEWFAIYCDRCRKHKPLMMRKGSLATQCGECLLIERHGK